MAGVPVQYRVVLGGDDDDPARIAVLGRRLRDRGFEVVHTGLIDAHALAETCMQEDADAVGPPVAGLEAALADRGIDDVIVFDAVDALVAALEERRGAT